MTADSLMNLAANKYKIRLRRNKWNAKYESETKILALEAKRDKPAWMTKAPSATEKGKSKNIDIKDYWWCDALACWCHHHPRKCEAKRKQGNKDEKKLKFASSMETVAHDKESESE